MGTTDLGITEDSHPRGATYSPRRRRDYLMRFRKSKDMSQQRSGGSIVDNTKEQAMCCVRVCFYHRPCASRLDASLDHYNRPSTRRFSLMLLQCFLRTKQGTASSKSRRQDCRSHRTYAVGWRDTHEASKAMDHSLSSGLPHILGNASLSDSAIEVCFVSCHFLPTI